MEPITIREIVTAVKGTLLYGSQERIVTQVSTNSKEHMHQGLFVPISGERVDAHDFIIGAIKSGAIAVFTSRHNDISALEEEILPYIRGNEEVKDNIAFIHVEDTKRALQDFAMAYRNRFHIPLIGISGSVGKTTTKEMISATLETKYQVLKTFGNMNSQVGVALMMFQLEKKHEVAVIEMGISEPNEMDRLVEIAQPKYGVLTNIGVSHIANLKTRENIRKEKAKLANKFTKESKLYINGNDEMLNELYQQFKKDRVSSYNKVELDEVTKEQLCKSMVLSFGTAADCEYKAVEIYSMDEATYFTLIYPGGMEKIKINVMGIHNVYNALVALALADELGIEPAIAKKGLEHYQPLKMRGQIDTIHGVKIIDDTYNASPDSMKSGVHILAGLSQVTRRIAVFADCLELGEYSRECHYEVGKYMLEYPIDILVTVGKDATFIVKALQDNEAKTKGFSFDTNEDAIHFLKTCVKSGDGILVKGSRGMHMEEIVEAMKEYATTFSK